MPTEMHTDHYERTQALLRLSKSMEPRDVLMADIMQLPTFQTRKASVENAGKRRAIRDADTAMMGKFINDLKRDSRHTTDPVTLCQVGERLILVDGHHRTDAFRQAERTHISARVLTTTEAEAHTLATIANNHSTTIPQGNEEKSEKAWREVLRHHDGKQWRAGWSARKFASLMDVAPKTIDRMVAALKKYGEDAKDMPWRDARSSEESRVRTTEEKLCGWITNIDKVDLQSDHELDVFIELIRTRYTEYGNKEELAERFAALHDDPKAFSAHLEAQMGEF